LTIGTKQLVVHEALDTTKSLAGSELIVVDTDHEGGVDPGPGAEMMTRLAPASRWAPADSRR